MNAAGRLKGLAVAACLLAAPAMAAAPPAALVESVSTPVPGVTALGYLTAGTTLDLGSGTVLVLDYLSQCVRETITGGTVTIGADQSVLHGGHLSRRRLDCDGGDLQVAASLSEEGAVTEYRAVGDAAALVVHSTALIVLPGTAGRLVIHRLDRAEADVAVDVPSGTGARPVLDLAAGGRALTPGGKYRATLGQRTLVFTVDPAAVGTTAPLLARMLPI